jgi:hypothetical protein
MARIVFIHGIGQQVEAPESLLREWGPKLRAGMRFAGVPGAEWPTDADMDVAFFGELFREDVKGVSAPPYVLADIDEGFEADMLRAWASQALAQDAEAGVRKGAWAPRSVQELAKFLLSLPFFASLTDRMLVGALKQLRAYLNDPGVRAAVRSRLADLILPDTRLVIAHSLGSIVAYEVLCLAGLRARPALITLGSPLGLRNLVFDRLEPRPVGDSGWWPRGAASWVNIADPHDLVALEKNLASLFGAGVDDREVNNGAAAHDFGPYLTSALTGKAVYEALRD